MIHEIQGDAVHLLEIGFIDGLAHCANAKGVMGAGIAKQIVAKYPNVLTRYHADLDNWQIHRGTRKRKLALGKVSVEPTHQVYSIIGQLNTGPDIRQVDYGAMAAGLSHIINTTMMPFKLGIPKYIGCGLAGGDWAIMEEIIYGMFQHDPNIDLYIIEYKQ